MVGKWIEGTRRLAVTIPPLQTVMVNLAYIETLLEEPNKKNPDHDWEDFK